MSTWLRKDFLGSLAGLLLLLCTLGAGLDAQAQEIAPPAAPPAAASIDPAEIEALIATLEDETTRAEFLGRLRALLAVQEQEDQEVIKDGLGARLLAAISAQLASLGEQIVSLAAVFEDPLQVVDWARGQISDPEMRVFWLRVALVLTLVLAAGIGAELLLRQLLRRPLRAILRQEGGIGTRVLLLLLRVVLEAVPLAGFALAAYVTVTLLDPQPAVRIVALAAINAAVLARLILIGVRAMLAPLAPGHRLLALSDESAAYAYVWARRFINVGVYGYFLVQLGLLFGMRAQIHAALIKTLGLLLTAMAVILILQIRERVAAAIRSTADRQGLRRAVTLARRRLADIWHVLAIVLILGTYLVWALEIAGGFFFILRGVIGTILLIFLSRLLILLAQRGLDRIFHIHPDLLARYPELEARANRYLPLARGLLSGAIMVAALLAFLEIWGIGVFGGLISDAGRAVVSSLLRIALILLVALALIEGANILVTRYLSAKDAQGNVMARSARTRTLLPLARNAIFVLVATIAFISILSEIGLDVAPLIAGAGVVGLAIGFGAQSLVKDVITGAFVLFEDAIAVGDVANVAGRGGVVEAISIRSIRLRDLDGTVNTIPWGTIDTVQNLTKEFSYYLLNVGVAYRENTDEVVALLKEILEEMRQDPAYGGDILEPLDVLGLDSFGDSAVILKARIKTRPIQQWRIGREFNRRMKLRFDDLGIEIPFPHRTVYFGVDKQGAAPPARIVHREARNGEVPARTELETAAGEPPPVEAAAPRQDEWERTSPEAHAQRPENQPEAQPEGEERR